MTNESLKNNLPKIIGLMAIVGVLGFFLAQGMLNPSAGFAISTSINPNAPTANGTANIFMTGFPNSSAYSSCYDTDGGNNPGEPGAVITFSMSAPVQGGNALPLISNLATVNSSFRTNGMGGHEYRVDVLNGHSHNWGTMVIYYDNGASATTYTEDAPASAGNEPGTPGESTSTSSQAAFLIEQTCECYTAYNGISGTPMQYTSCSNRPRNHVGIEVDIDPVKFPRGFEQFMQQSTGISLHNLADYLVR